MLLVRRKKWARLVLIGQKEGNKQRTIGKKKRKRPKQQQDNTILYNNSIPFEPPPPLCPDKRYRGTTSILRRGDELKLSRCILGN